MATVSSKQLVSVDDYLAGEQVSQTKHEFLGGVIYAIAGARNLHNLIATNLTGSLHAQLRGKGGKGCRPYNSDTKIRIHFPTHVRFYYPDASVICDPNSPDDSFQDRPALIAEVLSRATRRTDEGEKRDAYLSISSLGVYLLMEQEAAVVTVYRRDKEQGGFVCKVHKGIEAAIPLPEMDTELPLAQIYEDVTFSSEPEIDETG